jgi:hypothetical protein
MTTSTVGSRYSEELPVRSSIARAGSGVIPEL